MLCGGGRELLEAASAMYWPFVKEQIQAIRKDSRGDRVTNVEDAQQVFKQATGSRTFLKDR